MPRVYGHAEPEKRVWDEADVFVLEVFAVPVQDRLDTHQGMARTLMGRRLEQGQVIDPHRVPGGEYGFRPAREFFPGTIDGQYTAGVIDDHARVRQGLDEGLHLAVVQACRGSAGFHFSLPETVKRLNHFGLSPAAARRFVAGQLEPGSAGALTARILDAVLHFGELCSPF